MATSSYLSLMVLAAAISSVAGQCPPGFVQNSKSCYKVFPLSATWPEAVVLCRTFQSHLARISDQAEQDYIVSFISGLNKTEYPAALDIWLGASDLLVYGEWIWTDIHQPIGYSNWKPGEPSTTDENCLALMPGSNYLWNDAPCTFHANFLCEKDDNMKVESRNYERKPDSGARQIVKRNFGDLFKTARKAVRS